MSQSSSFIPKVSSFFLPDPVLPLLASKLKIRIRSCAAADFRFDNSLRRCCRSLRFESNSILQPIKSMTQIISFQNYQINHQSNYQIKILIKRGNRFIYVKYLRFFKLYQITNIK